jgi:16S rRNA (guanine527-N7)-methyltransferase
MPEFDAASLAREFAAYNLHLSPAQLGQVEIYLDLLLRWNRRINLTAIRHPRRIIRELFAESMYLGIILPLSGQLLDIGSGAGFPGLALKILQPQLAVTLLESNHRKCAFLEEVTSILQLSDIAVLCARLAEVVETRREGFNAATTRAVAVDARLLRAAGCVLTSGGILGVFTSAGAASNIVMVESIFQWVPPVALPGASRRVILVGRKPAAYPPSSVSRQTLKGC